MNRAYSLTCQAAFLLLINFELDERFLRVDFSERGRGELVRITGSREYREVEQEMFLTFKPRG